MKFSQRIGKSPIQEVIQMDTMTESFRNRLLNIIAKNMKNIKWREYDGYYRGYDYEDFSYQYNNHFGKRHTSQSRDELLAEIYQNSKEDSYFLYDFIEFYVDYFAKFEAENPICIDDFNAVFEIEKSAFRLADDLKLYQITDEIELQEMNGAIDKASIYSGVNQHLQNARSFFSNREKPNYNKTISESVDAIESLCRIIINDDKATLGQAIKNIKNIHPTLVESISKLYGFASDESAIRHSHKASGNDINEHQARFILVTSHSIVNYLISENLTPN